MIFNVSPSFQPLGNENVATMAEVKILISQLGQLLYHEVPMNPVQSKQHIPNPLERLNCAPALFYDAELRIQDPSQGH